MQESGRAGRDGQPAKSTVLNIIDQFNNSVEPQSSGFGPVRGLTEAARECRRWLVDLFMDGCSDRRPCQERGMEPCDICSSEGSAIALRRRASQF